MKVLVTGALGQIGHDCVAELIGRGHQVIGADIRKSSEPDHMVLDVTDKDAVAAVIGSIKPNAIIHCAAWTAVDAAEEVENRPQVTAVNHLGAQYVAEAAKAVDAKMIYLSTDYVFNGQGERPRQPEDRNYGPLNVYGQSKLDGELAVSAALEKYYIVRSMWAFGLYGDNFITMMLRAGKTHKTVRVVNDQIGAPTYTRDLARLLADMVQTDKYGYYHATNEGGYISRYDLIRELYRQTGILAAVVPVTTAEYGIDKAVRPLNSRLDRSRLVSSGFTPLPTWQDALHRYLLELGEIQQ